LPRHTGGVQKPWRISTNGVSAGGNSGPGFGTWLAWVSDFKPLHTLYFGSASVTVYSGLLALAANILVAILVSAALRFSARGDRNPAG
jgi:SSS family solute:Na+ symporter